MFFEQIFNFVLLPFNLYSTIFVTLATIIGFIIYKNSKFEVWEKQGVKGPKPLPFFGNALDLLTKPTITVLKDRHKKYGNVYGYYEMSRPVLIVSEPELVRQVLVHDCDIFVNRRPTLSAEPLIQQMLPSLRDHRWKLMRATLSTGFTSSKIKHMAPMISSSIQNLKDTIDLKVAKNEEINLKTLYGSFAMNVIASCAFAIKTNAHKNEDDIFVKMAEQFCTLKMWRMFTLVLLPENLRKFFNFSIVPQSVCLYLRKTVERIILERKWKKVVRKDLMNLLLQAEQSENLLETLKDINAEQVGHENKSDMERNEKLLLANGYQKEQLTEEEVIAQCLMFLVGGYENSASLLAYASYALATNEKCQDLLYQDVKHHFDTEGKINYETIKKMKYLKAFVNETLRLYTPVPRLDREATRDYKLPNTDITVPKGALVEVPLYMVHHDENNFPEPDKFKPERFLPENVDEIKPYSFIPFGCGPRNCIAMRFGLMEAKLALCNLVLRYKFVRSENTDVPLRIKNVSYLFLPVERVIARCEKRN